MSNMQLNIRWSNFNKGEKMFQWIWYFWITDIRRWNSVHRLRHKRKTRLTECSEMFTAKLQRENNIQ